MKTKLFTWMTIISMALLCGGFAACGGDDDEEEKVENPVKAKTDEGSDDTQKPDDGSEKTDTVSYLSCPDSNHPHMIDLGLPSGTKWACCNVGASAPEQYGGYYAWGETSEKSSYTKENYRYYDSSTGDFQNIGSDIAGTQYDVAHVRWGDSWRMPSLSQCLELLNNTPSEWTSQNGVYGCKFTGQNGGTIFLPAAGERWYSELYDAGSDGYFWSSTLVESYTDYAYDLKPFFPGSAHWGNSYRGGGSSVRPVAR